MRIAHNLTAMNSQRQLNINTKSRAKSVEKLSSGFRINRSADDAAGLAISEKMRRQIRGLTQASKNVQDGISFCQVADGALHEVDDMLHRINELSIKAANGTNTDEDCQYMDKEVQQIKDELTRIFETTEFNGIKIFKVPYTPSIKGNATDFVTYNKDETGRAGGMIINGERLTWCELGFGYDNLYQDGMGNFRFKEDTTIKRELAGGEILELRGTKDAIFEDISRVYRWSADSSGITINNNSAEKISWAEVKNSATNTPINTSAVEPGTYYFKYHGMTISFETEPSDKTIDAVIGGITGSGATKTASWYTVQSSSVPTNAIKLTDPSIASGHANETINLDAQTTQAMYDTGLRIYASLEGIGMISDNHPYTDYSFVTWEELGIKDWGVRDSDFGASIDGSKEYVYRDNKLTNGEIYFKFAIDENASEQSVLEALNNTSMERSFSYTLQNQQINTPFEAATDGTEFNLSRSWYPFAFLNTLKDITGNNTYNLNLDFDALTNGDANSDYKVTMTLGVADGKTATYTGTITRAQAEAAIQRGDQVAVKIDLQNKDELLSDVPFKQQLEHIKSIDSGIAQSNTVYISLNASNWGNDYSTNLDLKYTGPKGYVQYAEGYSRTANPIYSQIVDPPTKQLDIQAGSENELSNRITMEWSPLNLSIIGLDGTNVATQSSALSAIDAVKDAMKIVNDDRMLFGAYQNRFEHTVNSLENVIENTTAAESAIRDTDMAKASVELAKHNILLQVGQSMLAQANQIRENIISLLS